MGGLMGRGATAAARRRTVSNASGIPLPTDTVPGWTLALANDFDTDFAVGAVTSAGVFPAPYATEFGAYPDDWTDTTGSNFASGSIYRPSQVLSVSGSCLRKHLHVNNTDRPGQAQSAAVGVGPGGTYGRSYARVSICWRVPTVFNGWKTAWLLWPTSEVWPRDGEIDFPEGSITGEFSAFMHHQGGTVGGDQDYYFAGIPYVSTGLGGGWHVTTVEWAAGFCRFIADGIVIGTSYASIPNTPMRLSIQTETEYGDYPANFPISTDQGDVEIDWIAIWDDNSPVTPGASRPSATALFTEPFTGTNGAAWDSGRWSLTETATGASSTIQGNRGRLTSGTSGGYNNFVFRKATVTTPSSFLVEGVTRITDVNECYGQVHFRDVEGTAQNSYILQFQPGETGIRVDFNEGGNNTVGPSMAWTYSLNQEIAWEILCEGYEVQVRAWVNGGSRPSSPGIVFADASFLGHNVGIGLYGGNAAVSRTMEFDAVTVSSVP